MDIEFHYYMTYLIAAKAGFTPEEAETIAYSSQYVDDNKYILTVSKDTEHQYINYISQTMDITKPSKKLLRIYPCFHFIPGDPQAETAYRRDGKMHWLNTTPNSKNANDIIKASVDCGSELKLYRLGIAAHSYVDTWAHQNFVGYYDGFNSMGEPLNDIKPDIGHAHAGHNPDWPALIWEDRRLLKPIVDNRARFLEAAGHLFDKFCEAKGDGIKKGQIEFKKSELLKDLDWAIGDRDDDNEYKKARIERYISLSRKAGYGDTELVEYDRETWISEAIDTDVRGLKDLAHELIDKLDPLDDRYNWRKPGQHKSTDWFKFQEAVKECQKDALAVLFEHNFKGLALPNF